MSRSIPSASVFPIQIFKVKEGISYSEADYNKALENIEDAMAGKIKFETPNFDLLLLACKTTSTSLFPNFLFLDAPYNVHEDWRADDPDRFRYEVATMGCRTRVCENVNGPQTPAKRGNNAPISMNLPRLALETIYTDGKDIEDCQ